MARVKWWSGAILVVAMSGACGGGEKKVAEPEPVAEEEPEDEGDEMIPEEKFGEIQRTFERKSSTVARCFPIAVESGEVDKNERVAVSLGLVIQPDGTPTELAILGASKRSATLEKCIIESVSRWEFTTLPRPLQYSYGFKLQSF